MELDVRLLPVGDTTDPELAALADELTDALSRLSGVESVEPVVTAAPGGAKAVGLPEIGAFLLKLAPSALKEGFALVKAYLGRPGTPPVKIKVVDGKRSIDVTFDPRTMSAKDMADLVDRIRAAPSKG